MNERPGEIPLVCLKNNDLYDELLDSQFVAEGCPNFQDDVFLPPDDTLRLVIPDLEVPSRLD